MELYMFEIPQTCHMLPSNVGLCYLLNEPKSNEHQSKTASSLIQRVGKTQC